MIDGSFEGLASKTPHDDAKMNKIFELQFLNGLERRMKRIHHSEAIDFDSAFSSEQDGRYVDRATSHIVGMEISENGKHLADIAPENVFLWCSVGLDKIVGFEGLCSGTVFVDHHSLIGLAVGELVAFEHVQHGNEIRVSQLSSCVDNIGDKIELNLLIDKASQNAGISRSGTDRLVDITCNAKEGGDLCSGVQWIETVILLNLVNERCVIWIDCGPDEFIASKKLLPQTLIHELRLQQFVWRLLKL